MRFWCTRGARNLTPADTKSREKQPVDFAIESRTELIRDIFLEKLLLGSGEAHLSLVCEVEGLGNVGADAVAFETKAGACA